MNSRGACGGFGAGLETGVTDIVLAGEGVLLCKAKAGFVGCVRHEYSEGNGGEVDGGNRCKVPVYAYKDGC